MSVAEHPVFATSQPQPALSPRLGVIVFPGSNCDRDAGNAWQENHFGETVYLWHEDTDLQGVDAVLVPGGFSYGDALRAGAIAALAPMMRSVASFAQGGGLVAGVCNGFQVLCEGHLLPGALLRNSGLRFVCRHVFLRVENNQTPFTAHYEKGQVLQVPIAHGEGNYTCDDETYEALRREGKILFRYCDAGGNVTLDSNPNGSRDNIAGIIGGPKNNVLGMMPHPERAASPVLGSEDGAGLFASLAAALAER